MRLGDKTEGICRDAPRRSVEEIRPMAWPPRREAMTRKASPAIQLATSFHHPCRSAVSTVTTEACPPGRLWRRRRQSVLRQRSHRTVVRIHCRRPALHRRTWAATPPTRTVGTPRVLEELGPERRASVRHLWKREPQGARGSDNSSPMETNRAAKLPARFHRFTLKVACRLPADGDFNETVALCGPWLKTDCGQLPTAAPT